MMDRLEATSQGVGISRARLSVDAVTRSLDLFGPDVVRQFVPQRRFAMARRLQEVIMGIEIEAAGDGSFGACWSFERGHQCLSFDDYEGGLDTVTKSRGIEYAKAYPL